MAKKKNKLTVEPFDDIKLIGINTSMIDYQLAWYLNKALKINLVKYKSITTNDEDFYSFYFYDSGENSNAFNLVSLISNGKEWVRFKPKTDYLLIIRNYITDSVFQQYLSDIRQISKVNHAYAIDLDLNNKIEIILEDIEFHELKLIEEQNKGNNYAFSNCCKNLTSFSK